jgi:hypothetical protein
LLLLLFLHESNTVFKDSVTWHCTNNPSMTSFSMSEPERTAGNDAAGMLMDEAIVVLPIFLCCCKVTKKLKVPVR